MKRSIRVWLVATAFCASALMALPGVAWATQDSHVETSEQIASAAQQARSSSSQGAAATTAGEQKSEAPAKQKVAAVSAEQEVPKAASKQNSASASDDPETAKQAAQAKSAAASASSTSAVKSTSAKDASCASASAQAPTKAASAKDEAASSQNKPVNDQFKSADTQTEQPNQAKAATTTAQKQDKADAQKSTPAGIPAQQESSDVMESQAALSAGVYVIRTALDTNKVLDVPGASQSNSTPMQIYEANHSMAQRWTVSVGSDGLYEIVNIGSGKALDVAGAAVGNEATVQQYARNDTSAQRWHVVATSGGAYRVESALSSKYVLDVAGASKANGTRVQLYQSNGTKAQRWVFDKLTQEFTDGCYTIKNAGSGKVLDVAGASSANGANVWQYAANKTDAQTFGITYDKSTGYYEVTALNSGKVLDVAGAQAANGTNVQQYTYNATNAQKWALEKNADGSITFHSALGGLALDVSGASTESGANVQIYASNKTSAQKWKLTRVYNWLHDGGYEIASTAQSKQKLDVAGASLENGANVQVYASNGTRAQKWYIEYAGKGVYTVQTALTGNYLGVSSKKTGANVKITTAKQTWIPLLTPRGVELRLSGAKSLALNVASSSPSSGTNVTVRTANASKAQRFTLAKTYVSLNGTTYDNLSITLRQMAEYQKQSPYNDRYLVEELMDMLDPNQGEQSRFVDLRLTTGVSASALNSFISSTSSGRSGMLAGLGSAFVKAANAQGLNEVYLLAHAILESGWGTSTLAYGYDYEGGEIDGDYYGAGTYYNFYGIGAYDDSPLSGGRKLAIINGWNTPEKAVTGAAEWIANNYVYASSYAQPTLYAMKWDYARSNATHARGWHQYATGTSWSDSIAMLMDSCYDYVDVSGPDAYIIPRYAS